MPSPENAPPDAAEEDKASLSDTIHNLARRMLAFGSGPLAELRRMEPGGIGPPAYWLLAAKCGLEPRDTRKWQQIVRLMALLTPKGERQEGDRLHDRQHALGAALCDGGDPDWRPADPSDPDGVVSKDRLKRLTVTRGENLHDALERIVRIIARSRDRSFGIDCLHLARLLLSRDKTQPMQQLAYDYYARLDRPFGKSEPEGNA